MSAELHPSTALSYMGENRIWPITGGTISQEKVLFHPQTFSSSLFGFWHKCSKPILILIPSTPQGFYFFPHLTGCYISMTTLLEML